MYNELGASEVHTNGAHKDSNLTLHLTKLPGLLSVEDTPQNEEDFNECLKVASALLVVRKCDDHDDGEFQMNDCMYDNGPSITTFASWHTYEDAGRKITPSALEVHSQPLLYPHTKRNIVG